MKDRKQEEKKNEKRSSVAKIILAIVIVIILLLLFRCGVEQQNKQTAQELEQIVTDFEENVDAITEIEDAMRQEAVNTAVEEGMMNVNYSTKAVFNGKVSESFNIKNIENNHDSIVFEIFDENGDSLYKSKKIAPGYEMNCIELDKELSKGRHECTIEIQYAVEGHVATVFPLVIDVE